MIDTCPHCSPMSTNIDSEAYESLGAYEQWIVRSNLMTIHGGADAERIIVRLSVNGYPSIARVVREMLPRTALVQGKIVAR